MARQGGVGIFGPYRRANRFFIIVRTVAGSSGDYRSFASEAAAIQERDDLRAALEQTHGGERTVGEALDQYEAHLRDEGKKQRDETIRRIRSFFADDADTALGDLTVNHCTKLYDAVAARKATRWVGSGKSRKLVELDTPIATDTHRGMLTHAKTFLGWCVAKRWIRANPLEGLKGKGKKARGKAQLRIDEARKWESMAWEMAKKEPGAVGALCALFLGLRASEIVSRQVRDLDDDGRLLWIDDNDGFSVKTESSRRTVRVGDLLRPHLRALTLDRKTGAERPSDALLFGGDRRGRPHKRGWPLFWVKKICLAASVPLVGVHSMRGLASTLARLQGGPADLIAAAFGHSVQVAEAHYQQPGTSDEISRQAGLAVLSGERRPDQAT